MNKLKIPSIENMNICIIGLGYVGLPLAIEFSKKYKTVGFDVNEARIDELKSGYDKTLEVEKRDFDDAKFLTLSSEEKLINDCNIYIITVPTPIDKKNNPDLSYLKNASELVGAHLKKGNIVIYESTVFPGATEEYCVPFLSKSSGLDYNLDFFCGYSPERINPGDKNHTLRSIVKVTSGSNLEVANLIDSLYKSIIPAGTFKASSISVAEAAKVIENIQRDVNIALINELSMIFDKIDINTNEVLKAANSKWNFIDFRPGLVGGHCIGVDPYYLTHKAIESGYNPEMILAGRRINENMSNYIFDKVINKMNELKLKPKNANIAVMGVTFKENCPDIRNSKIFKIINMLINHDCNVMISDPMADKKQLKQKHGIVLTEFNELKNIDVVILGVGHDAFKDIKLKGWKNIFNEKGIFIDIKSLYNEHDFINSKIKYWSL
tara:strand:+ start:1033 stop:2343 length:1311 start_codon:yes stop_codon:yes gene_type:complete